MASQPTFGRLRIVAARLACFFVEANHKVVGNLFGVGSERCPMFVREQVDHGGTGKGFVEHGRKVIVQYRDTRPMGAMRAPIFKR